MVICSQASCVKPVQAKGLCFPHYQRLRRYGRLTLCPAPSRPRVLSACAVEGCSTEIVARGFCWRHYKRHRRHGDPLHVTAPQSRFPCEKTGCERPRVSRKLCGIHCRQSPLKRFFSNVEKTATCWHWRGGNQNGGYGRFFVSGEGGRKTHALAHRWLFEVMRGPIPQGLDLDHLCFTPSCVNPDHLEPVTHSENLRRMRVHQRTLRSIVDKTP